MTGSFQEPGRGTFWVQELQQTTRKKYQDKNSEPKAKEYNGYGM